MKSQLLEIGFVALTLVAALVSVSAVGAKGDLSSSNAPLAYAGGYPGGYPPGGIYPGGAYPPPWLVLVAPTQFPWDRMPTLPWQARWEQVPPVFHPPDPGIILEQNPQNGGGKGHGR